MPHARSGLSLGVTLLAASVVPAHAQSSGWTGALSKDWFASENWFGGVPSLTTDAIINTATPFAPEIASAVAAAQNLAIGPNGSALLTLQTGGALNTSFGTLGNLRGGVGTMEVTGAAAVWSNAGTIVVGGQGTGTLLVESAGTVESGGASIGSSAGSTGAVTVSGPGARWVNGSSGGLNIGSFGTGSLTIANGATVVNQIFPTAANIGNGAGSLGTVSVSGAGSSWSNSFGLNIGNRGTGTLTIANGGIVDGPVVIANVVGSTGTLNIGAGAGDAAAAPGTLTAPNIVFGAGAGTINLNHTSTDYVFAPAISGNGTVQVLAGTSVLTGANTYTGGTAVVAGTLRAGAAGAFSAASAHTVAPGATLDTGGFNQRVASLGNSGTVSLVSATGSGTLTVNGAYVGNAGVLQLGTGPSGSDRLVLDGAAAAASGSTSVRIVSLGALGAQTAGDGIEVISARNGATTTAQTTRSAFALAGGHVDAGAFEYRLHAADAQGAGENWYLRSTIETEPPVIPPVIPPVDPPVVPPVTPPVEPVLPPGEPPPVQPTPPTPPTVQPPIQVPTYRAEVPLLAALPGQVRQADLAMLGNLHRRMGDEAPGTLDGSANQAPSGLAEAGTRRAWGRFVYNDWGLEQPGVAQARADLRVSGLQAGTDLLVMDAWRAGVYVGYLDGSADVSGNARGVNGQVGSNDLRSRFLGAYATWMDASGWYFDSVLQGASHRYEIRPNGNPSASGKASGFMVSVEGGKALVLTERWSIEPQAQLAWQRNSFDDLLLGGARVQQDSGGGWIGRLGVRLKGDLATSAGRFQPYGRLNFYHANFSGDTALFIGPAASTLIASEGSYSAGEVAAGATLALTPATSLYGEIGTLWNIGGDANVKSSLQGALGIKLRW